VKKTRLSLAFVFLLSAAGLSACGQAHLSSQFAASYTAWFNVQHVKAKPGNAEEAKRIIESLDAPEAAAVSKNYRRAVSRGEDAPRLLTIGTRPGSTGTEAYMPPPSVPQ
jgi:hypothetical protein